MDVRKIIGFGKSTFSMTLPKKWVQRHSLKKGDTVSVRELPDGKLEISPGAREEKPQVKNISISIANRSLKEIQREFIAAYTKGYSAIHLVGSHEGKVSELRRRLHELIAVEIMEVTTDRITANVFFDVSAISLPGILSRIEIITKNIIEDTQNLLKKQKNLPLAYKEIMEKKREVDRQSLFAIRIIVNGLTDPVFAASIESNILNLSYTWHLIEYMEKISDYILNIAFYMTSTDFLKTLGKKGKDDLYGIFSAIGQEYSLALESYNKNSIGTANKVFDSHLHTDRELYAYIKRNRNLWSPVITGYLRRTSSKSRDIARITINSNIG